MFPELNDLTELFQSFVAWLTRNHTALSSFSALACGSSACIAVSIAVVRCVNWARGRAARAIALRRRTEETVPLTAAPAAPSDTAETSHLPGGDGSTRGRPWWRIAFVLFVVLFFACWLFILALDAVKPVPADAVPPVPENPTPLPNPVEPIPLAPVRAAYPAGLVFLPLPESVYPAGKVLAATETEITQGQFRAAFPGHVPFFSERGRGGNALRLLACDDSDFPIDCSRRQAIAALVGGVGARDTSDFPVDCSPEQAEAFCRRLTDAHPDKLRHRLMTVGEFRALTAGLTAGGPGSVVRPVGAFRTWPHPEPVRGGGAAFRHLFGNVAEIVTDGDRYLAVGGSYLDVPEKCEAKAVPCEPTASSGEVGFRVVREAAAR